MERWIRSDREGAGERVELDRNVEIPVPTAKHDHVEKKSTAGCDENGRKVEAADAGKARARERFPSPTQYSSEIMSKPTTSQSNSGFHNIHQAERG